MDKYQDTHEFQNSLNNFVVNSDTFRKKYIANKTQTIDLKFEVLDCVNI